MSITLEGEGNEVEKLIQDIWSTRERTEKEVKLKSEQKINKNR